MERKKNIPAFIRNIYQMLQKRQQLKEIVSWLQLENGFVIKNLTVFTNEVLPQYFKHKKYLYYYGKLNMYGFHKQRSKDNYHSYGHQFFKKGVLENKDKVLFEAVLKRKPEKKKKASNQVINELKHGKSQLERSISQPQISQNRSVSIELEDQGCPIKQSQTDNKLQLKKQLQKKESKERFSQLQAKEIDEDNQEESSTGNQSKIERIVVQQNSILQSVHTTIREQLLKCKEITKNTALGYGQILNQSSKNQSARRLTLLLNEQNLLLQKLLTFSNDYSQND